MTTVRIVILGHDVEGHPDAIAALKRAYELQPQYVDCLTNISKLPGFESTEAYGHEVLRLLEASKVTGAEIEAKIVETLNAQAYNKIHAIKLYRVLTGNGLKESKDYVEALMEKHNIPLYWRP